MPKVSVIIPTHNRSEMLKKAIDSVLSQTFKDFEINIVDDNSHDNTELTVSKYKDNRINYVFNKGKNGPSVSRNKGIAMASSEYVAFLDDDDEWLPEKLEKQIAILDSCTKDVCGIYSNRLMINKLNGETYSENPGVGKLRGNLLYQLMIKNPIHTSTLVVRRECFEKIGYFDETMQYMEDRDLFIRLSMNWDIEYLDEPLTKAYYHGGEHLSRNLEGQTQGREIILDRYQKYFRKNKKIWSKLFICLGAQYCQLGDMKKGRSNLLKGIVIYPYHLVAFYHLLTSLLGIKAYQRIRLILKAF